MRQEYLKTAGEVDMAHAERAIRRAGVLCIVALLCAVPAGYFIIPLLLDMPTSLPERLAFAARASAVVLLCLMLAVLLVSTGRRTSPSDIGGSAAAPPSPRIAIRVAFLQNTLVSRVRSSHRCELDCGSVTRRAEAAYREYGNEV